MYPTLILQTYLRGQWHEIGWRASTPKSAADLREHGRRLAAAGGQYRLVYPSIYRNGEPEVVHEYAVLSPLS